MKRIISILIACIMVLSLAACADTNVTDTSDSDAQSELPIATDSFNDKESEFYTLTLDGVNILDYTIVVPESYSISETNFVSELRKFVKNETGETMKMRFDTAPATEYEILVGVVDRPETEAIKDTVADGGYTVQSVGSGKVVVIFHNDNGMELALNALLRMMISGKGEIVIAEPSYIVSSIGRLRDPSILLVDGVYYAYGTGWVCYKNTDGLLSGNWVDLGVVADIPEDAETNYWAPEVHEYNGSYYMFTTYKSKASGHRGCVIFKSDSPEGPFVQITNGHITPKDWDSIDGTLYVDGEGQPWMVFVHEWTSTDDGIGRMAAAKLSNDLTHFISEPIELFRADDASWCVSQVTDGCWMYRCENGELLMLWSSSDKYGYCVGIARSDNGRLDGNWTHDETLLFSKSMTGDFDGGHAMIFTSIGGQMYLSLHSPNNSAAGRNETPVFVEIREVDGTLVWANK